MGGTGLKPTIGALGPSIVKQLTQLNSNNNGVLINTDLVLDLKVGKSYFGYVMARSQSGTSLKYQFDSLPNATMNSFNDFGDLTFAPNQLFTDEQLSAGFGIPNNEITAMKFTVINVITASSPVFQYAQKVPSLQDSFFEIDSYMMIWEF